MQSAQKKHSKKRTGSKRAVAAVEVLIGVLILSFGLIPIYSIFTSSKKTVFKSEVSYLALNAAREKLDEFQLLPLPVLIQLAQGDESDWRPVVGSAYGDLVSATSEFKDPAPVEQDGDLPASQLTNELFNYPENYERIKLKTKVELLPVYPVPQDASAAQGPPWLFRVQVKVRWQEKGEDVQAKEDRGAKIFKSRFERIFSVGGTAERDKP